MALFVTAVMGKVTFPEFFWRGLTARGATLHCEPAGETQGASSRSGVALHAGPAGGGAPARGAMLRCIVQRESGSSGSVFTTGR